MLFLGLAGAPPLKSVKGLGGVSLRDEDPDDVQDALVISVLVILMLGLYFLAVYFFMRS